MDNFKDTFLKKLSFVIRMVMYFGAYKILKDWWEVATVNSSSGTVKKGKTHEYGTSFRVERLDKMFKEDYDKTLSDYNIRTSEDKYEIYYKRLAQTDIN